MTEKQIPQRADIPSTDQWDLTPLFAGDREWHETFENIQKEMENITRFKGRLHESVELFHKALEFDMQVSRQIERLYTYAHLKNDQDKADPKYDGLYQQAVRLYTTSAELSSFIPPEILAMDEDTVNRFLGDERIAPFAFYLEKMLRARPHTLSQPEEQILAASREMAQAPSQVFGQLDNVDMTFGTMVDDTGARVELSHGNFTQFLMNPERKIRKTAFQQYYKAYEAHKHTNATALAFSVKKDLFYSKTRRFETARKAALFDDNIPESVYDNLIDTVRKNLAPLFKYLEFRKEALGLDTLHFYDTYVPILGGVSFKMSYEEAVSLCIKALAPLGPAYTATLEKGLLGGWVDRYENRGKRSGAYSSGCYDSPPYILLNHDENAINSIYTLIHEAGHSMHSHYAATHQPYVDHGYTIFVAEVASTFNETLLTKYLLETHGNDPRMTAYLLNREIDNIRGTLFRQTMFAEFEKITHRLAEENQPLTLERFTRTYRGLLDAYFGTSLTVDPELELECLRIPHFYNAFYVYKYATGISAAIALADRVLSGGEPARNAYLNFLKLGGSKFPLDELLDAGVDMGTPDPIEKAIRHFDQVVDRLISVYKTLS